MLELLKKASPHATPQTLKVYLTSIKRLYKTISNSDVPKNGTWLVNPELKKKVKALPLGTRRSLNSGALIASKMWDLKKAREYWAKEVETDSTEYDKKRSSNKASEKEKENWTGYAALKKASTEYKRSIGRIFKNPDYTTKSLFLYTKYVCVRFYSTYAFRNELATVKLEGGSNDNLLIKKKGGTFKVALRQHKTSRKVGTLEVDIDKNVSKVLKRYIKYRSKVPQVTHKFLLSNSRGAPLSQRMLGNILREITSRFLGKRFATRQLRIMQATADSELIKKAQEAAKKQLHSIKQHGEYARKIKDKN